MTNAAPNRHHSILRKIISWGTGIVVFIFGLFVLLSPVDLVEAASTLRHLAGPQAGSVALVDADLPSEALSSQAAADVRYTPYYTPYEVTDPNAYVYQVRMGESWRAIAHRFSLSYSDLLDANQDLWQIRGVVIHPADEMAIPGLEAGQMVETITYEVQPGDSWRKIADMNGIFFWDLKLDNYGLWQHRDTHIQPGDMLTIRNSVLAAPVAADPARSAEADAESATDAEETEAAEVDPVAIEGPLAPAVSQPLIVEVPPSVGDIYTVRPGDSWYAIASANNVTFEQLRGANPNAWRLRGSNLRVGDQLIIPARDETVDPPGIREEETPEDGAADSAEEADTKPTPEPTEEAAEEPVQEATAEPTEEPTEEPTSEPAEESTALRFMTVAAGDTWASIAASEGVTVEALKAANVDFQSRELVEGDEIRLP